MSSLGRFLAYNNAVPISISIVFLTSGAAFAASPEIREEVSDAILSTETQVVTVDNTYIVSKDLQSYTPSVVITSVTEDANNYYVAYRLQSINVHDYVWQDIVRDDILQVSKGLLGANRDLGEFATIQFKELIDRELRYLREAQQQERGQVTQKTVATIYGGLVGRFLDDTTEVLPGYTPVVVPPPPPVTVSPAGDSSNTGQTAAAAASSESPPPPPPVNVAGGPQIQVLGNNPARIQLRSVYIDLGVIAMDALGRDVGVRVFVNDQEKSSVQIDTSVVGQWRIRYEASDSEGRVSISERIVEVYDPYPAPPPVEPAPSETEENPATSSESIVQ